MNKLSPCWPIKMCCGYFWAEFAICYMTMEACYSYCNGQSIKTVTQPVYAGPWKRAENPEPPKRIGTFYIMQRFIPVGLCCACPLPFRYYYKATEPEGVGLETNDRSVLAMVLQLYRGMLTPCKICSPAGFRVPMGIPFF